MPVSKASGEPAFEGTMNLDGMLDVTVTRRARRLPEAACRRQRRHGLGLETQVEDDRGPEFSNTKVTSD